ncbi:MAG: zinc-binding alcohol dehydrogenase [Candidatus Poribacteria bacterium]|nr:zinc-binding alcohol dehydrogenase [Candidatus Poribacteria bacterium]
MPKELVAVAVQQPVLREYEDGPVPEGHLRVKVEFGAPKRGTELTLYHGARGAKFPMGLGNMCVGRVVEVGEGVDSFSIDDRVASHGNLRETHTWHVDRVWRMSDRMTWKEAVCFDPAHFALSGTRDGQVRLGDRVAIFGLGAIGQMAVQMARMAGASFVAAVDPLAKRREVAENAGADLVLDPTAVDVGAELKKATGDSGLDVAIETSASYEALDGAIRGLAFGGTVAVVGWMKECTGGLDLGAVAHVNIPNLIFARANSDPNRDHPRWDFQRIRKTCWGWLAEGRFQCEEIVDPVVPFAESAKAYEEMDFHPEKSIKLGVAF